MHTFGINPGPMMAAADRITIEITGQGEKNGVGSCFLHNNRYDFNDDILPFGPALHASLVERAMPI